MEKGETIEEYIKRMEIEMMTPEELGDKIVDDFLKAIDKILSKKSNNSTSL